MITVITTGIIEALATTVTRATGPIVPAVFTVGARGLTRGPVQVFVSMTYGVHDYHKTVGGVGN